VHSFGWRTATNKGKKSLPVVLKMKINYSTPELIAVEYGPNTG
jgi:hypothetical protein